MAYLGNSPTKATMLRVEARKSFSLGVWIRDDKGRLADLTGCELVIVAKRDDETTDDTENLLLNGKNAVISDPRRGYCRFELQAEDLALDAGNYPYAIVLRANGYSSVIVKGDLEVVANPETESVLYTYSGVNPPQTISVLLRGTNSLNVFVGGQLPPGMNYVRDDVLAAIEDFDPDSVALVPNGGTPGYVLTKTGTGDYSMAWLPVGNGQFALDATGLPANMVPTAVGDDTWIWKAVGVDATGVPAGYAPVANGDGTWDWGNVSVDWNAASGTPGSILNKPALNFLPNSTTLPSLPGVATPAQVPLIGELRGVVYTPTIPTTGIAGYLYLVYTP